METEAQLEFLRAEGCEAVQGFLIGKPVSHTDATAFMERFELERNRGAAPGRLA